MECPKCGKKMFKNFTSWSCDNCDGKPDSTFYTSDTLTSLTKTLGFPKSRKKNEDIQHFRLVTPSYGDVDEIDQEILIPYSLDRISHIDVKVRCDDVYFQDYQYEWEVLNHGNDGNKPKIRVYIYGDPDFLPNYVYFDVKVIVKLNDKKMSQV